MRENMEVKVSELGQNMGKYRVAEVILLHGHSCEMSLGYCRPPPPPKSTASAGARNTTSHPVSIHLSMSKRKALTEALDSLRIKRRKLEESMATLDAKITKAKQGLAKLDAKDKEARALTVDWRVFHEAAGHSLTAWKEIAVTDPYHQCDDCANRDTCWYSGNMDRLDGLQLFTLETVDDSYSLTLCDLCLPERHEHMTKNPPVDVRNAPDFKRAYKELSEYELAVDPKDYEPVIAAYLRDADAGKDVSKVSVMKLMRKD